MTAAFWGVFRRAIFTDQSPGFGPDSAAVYSEIKRKGIWGLIY
jgi:hypothetical protein